MANSHSQPERTTNMWLQRNRLGTDSFGSSSAFGVSVPSGANSEIAEQDDGYGGVEFACGAGHDIKRAVHCIALIWPDTGSDLVTRRLA